MADSKITDLTELTTPASADVVAIVDDTTGTPVTKKITYSNLESNLSVTASQVSDFDTEVGNNGSVVANTAKITNQTHTGAVTGSIALTIAANAVNDTHIDWGTGANQVSQDDVVNGATYVRTHNDLTDGLAGSIVVNNAKITNQTHTGDVTGSIALTIANDAVDIAMLSATGTADSTTFLRGDNAWTVPAGTGDVSKVGTPVDSQVGVWTGNGTIEGTSGLTYDGTAFDVFGNITLTGSVDGIDIATDVTANTLKNTNVSTNITIVEAPTNVDVQSSDGTNDTIAAANATNAGVMSKAIYDNYVLNNDKLTNATHSGDATGAGALTLATVNSDVGSYTNADITVNAKGLVTAAANGTGGGGLAWSDVTGTTQAATVNYGYVANNASLVTITLASTASVGDILRVVGLGNGGWRIAQNASEYIYFGNATTTTGTGGYLEFTHSKDSIELVCVVANTGWSVMSSVGNITVA